MLVSMTGYGTATVVNGQGSVTAELRSVNSRFYEFSARLPKHLQTRELELKDVVRARIRRGKVNLSISVDKNAGGDVPLKVDAEAARAYVALLRELQQATGIEEEIRLETVLKFSDVFRAEEQVDLSEEEWEIVLEAVEKAAGNLHSMRAQEGAELAQDLRQRIVVMNAAMDEIEKVKSGRSELEYQRLKERLGNLITDEKVDPERLEMEIALLADKMDITEELVRFRSHTKFFLEALDANDSEGRKLSFLLQEMNREANTISSKSYDAGISHVVVSVKEELERIREQIQNIE
ncbi:MAG: YicC/YloC family endoribonuclease [Bacteroidota bacterium]|nr:YicC/YloC family endoribonuclease [Bacteroidota bacterium]